MEEPFLITQLFEHLTVQNFPVLEDLRLPCFKFLHEQIPYIENLPSLTRLGICCCRKHNDQILFSFVNYVTSEFSHLSSLSIREFMIDSNRSVPLTEAVMH